MSAQDWFIYFGTCLIIPAMFIGSEVRMFRRGCDSYRWVGRVSRAFAKVGL